MRVHFGFEDHVFPALGRTVATLGNYDGVHLGHQLILKETVTRARKLSLPSVVVTFDPVPRKILDPASASPLIQTLEQRVRKLESLQLDHAVVLAFNAEFAKKSPEEFVREYLVRFLRIREFVVGENFSFGHQRRGNVALLKEMGKKLDFLVEGIPVLQLDGIRVSSTLIRTLIREGRMEEVWRYLGDPFAVMGTIIEGERLGGRIGIPTANLNVENEIIPANGVYVSRAFLGSNGYPAVTNVGFRPTFGGKKLTVEAHLLDFLRDLYGQKMELQFLSRIRQEMRFSGVEELKAQIYADIQYARSYFQLPNP